MLNNFDPIANNTKTLDLKNLLGDNSEPKASTAAQARIKRNQKLTKK